MAESDDKSSSMSASAASAALGGLMGSVSEKWNSSGASDAVARINANIPQGTKDMLSSASSKIQFRREHLRSPTIFFGLGEEKPFYLEKNPALLMPRLKHNVKFFYLNYAVLTGILFMLTVLVSPSALIGMALLAFAWMSVIKSTDSGEMRIKGITVSQKQAYVGMSVVSVVVLFYLLSHIFWWTMFTSGFLVGSHAALRDASMHKDEEDKVAMSGDLSLEEEQSAFLGDEV
eukprot:CAMPEP_0185825448 /NCGR_PEP_ID=MMETSP1322-20130828/31052_1 /TAXON_ID=265543 /ORGANISM="Minutocellus polymorphus, Strain RCC2270" /LENGTH=231 /DNA_ID=CAMNT_0028523171 /DNA_START=48 /DNA_END=743 /DNA_ORIENTATION=+